MTFTFNSLIPAANNNPSADQPDMLTNNVSTRGIIAVDHFGFDVANGGRHLQVQLPLRGGSPGTIPPSLIAQEGTLYTKTVTSSGASTETGLFYTPDLSANQYQLTRTITASFALFGTNTGYLADHTGGWTFLPGGMLLQYGARSTPGTSGVITYPVVFTTGAFSIQLTMSRNASSSTQSVSVDNSIAPSASSFAYRSSSSSTDPIYWVAIGV